MVLLNFIVSGWNFYEGRRIFVDTFSGSLVVLCMVLVLLIKGLYSRDSYNFKSKEVIWGRILGLILIYVFMVDNWLGFYVVYEGRAIPLLVGVIIYGGYYERLGRVVYLLVYMILFSVPLAFTILIGLCEGLSLKMGV